MDPQPSRGVWAVSLAALVGGVGGSFLAGSMDSLGLTTGGQYPLLAGDAELYTAFALGALLGPGVAAVAAYVLARAGHVIVAAVGGSMLGLLAGGLVGAFAENAAVWWTSEFSSNPYEGAAVGALIAGAAGGLAIVSVFRAGRPAGSPAPSLRFAGLLGSIAGLLAGVGGGGVGFSLAESTKVCPNGYSGYPAAPPPNCFAGVGQGSLILGVWFGAAAGALGALATAWVLSRVDARLGSDGTEVGGAPDQ